MEDSVTPSSSAPFTRSATEPLTKTHCFFCQTDEGQNLSQYEPKTLEMHLDKLCKSLKIKY